MLVSDTTGIPLLSLDNNTTKFFRSLERSLQKDIVGQKPALEKVCSSLKRAHAHLNDPNQPVGTFLFLGTTGVGKTHLCKLLAKYLFGSDQRMIRLDMSEFMESHSVSKLTGAPPGYVGHESTNSFVETIRKYPYSLVLFDEIEKANPQVLNLLLQVLDEGHLTDSHGRKINFKNTVIVMTSNLGTELYSNKSIGFIEQEDADTQSDVKAEAIKNLRPEFVNRIDEIVVFNRLELDDLRKIVKLQFDVFNDRIKANYKISLKYDIDVIDYFIDEEDTKKYGARQLKRSFRKHIENKLAELFVSKKLGTKDILVSLKSGEIQFKECSASK
jgi:ATP-dependent Clp protease ATP-binding subunit ClpC